MSGGPHAATWLLPIHGVSGLLKETGAKVAAVAAEVGYESEAAFSRAFKKATGLAPGTWRQSRQARGLT